VTAIERASKLLVWIVAGVTAVFLLTPLLVTIAVSFGSSTVFTLPPPDWSLRWYERLLTTSGLWQALWISVHIAALSTGISLALGTLCAIALVQGTFPGRNAIIMLLVSPLMLPGLVIGIAMLQTYRAFGLRDAYFSLLAAHVIITMPYVVRTVFASLSLFDFTMIDAARTLGESYAGALRKVLIPTLAPAFLTAGMFAFLASMDNYSISIFFTDARTKTLPIQMLQFVEESPDPRIAAISTGLILLAIVALLLGDRLVGLKRLAEF
jgi:putative spermidine/putrescine transport system permease protein